MEHRVLDLLAARRHVPLRRLVAPAPGEEQLRRIFDAAAQAPDHGLLRPWRFIVISAERRAELAGAFVAALLEHDPGAAPDARERASEKALHAPCLVAAVLVDDPAAASVAASEKLVSLGCAVQNMLLAAEALGFGSGIASGATMDATATRRFLRLAAHESAICFVGFGTPAVLRPARARPTPEQFVSIL